MDVIEEYISRFPEAQQEKLREVRRIIREAAPDATEKISYQMPTFYLNGNLVHFAMQKAHLGFYPGASGVEYYVEHMERLGTFKYSKGAIQFPLSRPLPGEVISEIVAFRVRENTGIGK